MAPNGEQIWIVFRFLKSGWVYSGGTALIFIRIATAGSLRRCSAIFKHIGKVNTHDCWIVAKILATLWYPSFITSLSQVDWASLSTPADLEWNCDRVRSAWQLFLWKKKHCCQLLPQTGYRSSLEWSLKDPFGPNAVLAIMASYH